MFSKTKKTERIDSEQREQYEYARRRIKQKKNLMRHFIFFLAGSIFVLVIEQLILTGDKAILFNNWSVWIVLIWTFILLIHVFNVFVMNKFMGKEWEDRQLEKLKAKQTNRINELQKKVDNDIQLPKKEEVKKKENNNPLPPDVQ